MTGDAGRVFISHAGADRAWAEWAGWQLEDAGYSVELDTWDWSAGDNFVLRMNDALAAGRMLALFSEAYFDRARFTTEEWTAVLAAREKLVPVRIDDTPAPPMLRALIAPSLVNLGEPQARRVLLTAMAGPRRPGSPPAFPAATDGGRLRELGGSGPRLPGSLPRVWNLPKRNAGFSGRDALLVHLRRALAGGSRVAVRALRGRGGVGKTQLAIEYAHRFAGEYELAWWIRSETPELIPEQLAALAVRTGSAGPDDRAEDACEALAEELRTRGRWLLVFDNAEDPAALAPYLPEGGGHVLITSRNPHWAVHAMPVEVDTFARAESVSLLRARVPNLGDTDADLLARALDDLPLALDQAAALLVDGLTPAQCLRLLEERISLVLDAGHPDTYPVSLAAQIRLSTERLAQVRPAALTLLRACALLAPEPFPLHACTHPVAAPHPVLAGLLAEPLRARDALGALARQGLARVQDGAVQVHRLTQAVVRDQLSPAERADASLAAETLLTAALPGDPADPPTWAAWSDVIPHLLAVDVAALATEEGRSAVRDACWYLMDRGNAHTALPRLEQAHAVWLRQLGPDHPDTLWAAHHLARACGDTGDHARARDLDEDTLARRRRVLGPGHPYTLRSADNLAIRLGDLGDVEAARALAEETFEQWRAAFGQDDPDTLGTAGNLAIWMADLGEVEAARELGQDTLERMRQVLGPDHPETLRTATNLAVWQARLGQTEAARDLGQDTLERQRRLLGPDHPDALRTASNLAIRLADLGEVEAARDLGDDTLRRRRRVLGDDHPETLRTASNLAIDLMTLGETDAARTLARDTRDRRLRLLGEDHPDTTLLTDLLTELDLPPDT
ncbi:FxSxx-COOH system tetratricopeptide repeat protein [Streptomyces specialis]|uniref:FxSxx-COOH system tetratricopeptide repeat protein n=1 Tax=Streptomyces specialis TaxID=498367 RepID=UPI00073F4D15|nr:FxSxx-COOH system tetratricopeptide repeat protein [Streptomyces specialis]